MARKRRLGEDALQLGPSSVSEMFSWAQDTWELLLPENQSLLTANVLRGLELMSFYSGKGSAEAVMFQIADRVLQSQWIAETSNAKPVLQPVESVLQAVSASDLSSLCQQVLGSLQGARPEHIFGDTCLRVVEPVRLEAQKLLPSKGASLEDREAAHRAVGEFLMSRGRECFPAGATSYCHVHKQQCELWASVDEVDPKKRKKLLLAAAGMCCADYSPRRTAASPGLAGKTTVPFFSWAAEMKALLPDVIYYENVPPFPVPLLEECFPEYTNHYLHVSPADYGFPVSRKRLFGVLTLNETVVLSADLNAFQESFKRALCVDGDIFWMAPVEDVLASYEDRASSRGNFLRRSGSRESWTSSQLLDVLDLSKVATCATCDRLVEYQKLWAQRCDGQHQDACVIVDLNQNAGYSAIGHLIPSVPTHFSLFSFRHRRLLTGNEALASFGENIYHQEQGPPSLLPHGLLASMAEKDKQFLTGNSWHIPVFGQFAMFTLAHLQKLPKLDTLGAQLFGTMLRDCGAKSAKSRSNSFLTDASEECENDDDVGNMERKHIQVGLELQDLATPQKSPPLKKRSILRL